MNPSYLSIQLEKSAAVERFSHWIGLEKIDGPRKVKYSNSIDESTTGDEWRGDAVFVYESRDKTIFEDLTGFLASHSAESWLDLAQDDACEFIGYNDSVPYGQIIIINKGSILIDFLHDEQEPSENRNIGDVSYINCDELNTWIDAAGYVDSEMDKIELPEEGDLIIFKSL